MHLFGLRLGVVADSSNDFPYLIGDETAGPKQSIPLFCPNWSLASITRASTVLPTRRVSTDGTKGRRDYRWSVENAAAILGREMAVYGAVYCTNALLRTCASKKTTAVYFELKHALKLSQSWC